MIFKLYLEEIIVTTRKKNNFSDITMYENQLGKEQVVEWRKMQKEREFLEL